jgi:hypothetical protein
MEDQTVTPNTKGSLWLNVDIDLSICLKEGARHCTWWTVGMDQKLIPEARAMLPTLQWMDVDVCKVENDKCEFQISLML